MVSCHVLSSLSLGCAPCLRPIASPLSSSDVGVILLPSCFVLIRKSFYSTHSLPSDCPPSLVPCLVIPQFSVPLLLCSPIPEFPHPLLSPMRFPATPICPVPSPVPPMPASTLPLSAIPCSRNLSHSPSIYPLWHPLLQPRARPHPIIISINQQQQQQQLMKRGFWVLSNHVGL